MEEVTEITASEAEARAQVSAFQIVNDLQMMNKAIEGDPIDSCGALERFRQIFLRVLASQFVIVPD